MKKKTGNGNETNVVRWLQPRCQWVEEGVDLVGAQLVGHPAGVGAHVCKAHVPHNQVAGLRHTVSLSLAQLFPLVIQPGAGLPVAVHVKTTWPVARTSTLAGATAFQRRWDQRGEITNDSAAKRRWTTRTHRIVSLPEIIIIFFIFVCLNTFFYALLSIHKVF